MPWETRGSLNERPSPDTPSGEAVIQGLDTIVLVKDHPDEGLVKGDMGAVVLVHTVGQAREVEFVTLTGDTLGVLTLTADEVRPISARDAPHVRVA
ncbi:DUF4926 domain-containing protein [Acidithiobacillus sp. M4-SHS-6]|uniref:DUF4926 domain-containing protein n=1 Tax=Acidithiobacillus sp. M4-SHS-6 TaxID=3383024 RepID=UPI0039BE646B